MKSILYTDQAGLLGLFGAGYSRKKEVETLLGVSLIIRNDFIQIKAPSKPKGAAAEKFLQERLQSASFNTDVESSCNSPALPTASGGNFITSGRKQNIYARTEGQIRFFEAVKHNDLVFAIGPAGTGKTYMAVAMAIEALRRKSVERIILARPAVEAGESLGFLPGNLKEKVDPYLAPLYDALYDMLPKETVGQFFVDRTIEVSPLAYMRGRTLHNAFIILDEAQNATVKQLKMFLTRLGTCSKAIVCGDVTQVDLRNERSGLCTMEKMLSKIPDIEFIHLDGRDVMRHKLVKEIIRAYDDFEAKNG
ncbi:MAG: PhoH family protein [Fibrobacteres bacterium]|nr:PhoH family protein [Fibrobacterota bacterium]